MSKRAASSKAKSQVASANLEPEAGQQHLVESPRRKRSKQPDDEVASRAAELRRGGAKQCDIATELGFTQRQVSSMLAKHGLQTQKQLSEAEAAEVVDLCSAGMKQCDAAIKFGVSTYQICKIVARGGAAPRAKAAAKRRVQDPQRNAARTSAREQREFDIMDATVFAVSEYMFVGDEYRLELLVRQSAYFGESHSKFGCKDLSDQGSNRCRRGLVAQRSYVVPTLAPRIPAEDEGCDGQMGIHGAAACERRLGC